MTNRITNNTDVYRSFIWEGLSEKACESRNDYKWKYIELSQFLEYGFSCSLQNAEANNQQRLHVTRWVGNHKKNELVEGLFLLDKCGFENYTYQVSKAESPSLAIATASKLNTVESEGVVLDGIQCELSIEGGQNNLIWSADYQMNKELSQLVMNVREIYNRTTKNNAANTGYTPTPADGQARGA